MQIIASRMLAGLAALCAGPPALAHHNGYVCLDRTRTVTIQGEVLTYTFGGPHVVFTVRTDANTIYTAEWMTPPQMQRWGVGAASFAAGDLIVVRGSPYTCEANKLSLLAEVHRPRDHWDWSSPLYR